MAQTKIYPSTQAQVQTVQSTVDEINSKIVTPKYQAKIVTPTTSQQLIEPDNGYDALSSVTVNPAQTTDLDNWISRNDQQEPIYLELTTDKIASYACYGQQRLVSFSGDNVILIGNNAFERCTSLWNVNIRNVTSIGNDAFRYCSGLLVLDIRNVNLLGGNALYGCSRLIAVDMRNVASINTYAFFEATSLQLLDLTSCTAPPTLGSYAFLRVPSTARYVFKDATVKAAVQSATNWSVIASQIYTVAEIEALVGMTYDEYYLQIFGHPRND